jgi:DNA circularisation protein N-terminus
MNGSQVNVIGQLPELQWRGLKPVPVEDASYDFSHDQVERRYPYIDGVGHDHTGRGAIRFAVRLLFLNTLQNDLYPHIWEDWRAALFDGSAGDLVHPELGTVRTRVVSGSVKISAHSRAGVTVDVTWVGTLEDPERAPGDIPVLAISLNPAAKAADTAVQKLQLAYPKTMGPKTTNLANAIASIEAKLFLGGLSVLAPVNQLIAGVRQLQDAVSLLDVRTNNLRSAVSTWPALYNLELVEYGLVELQDWAQRSPRPVLTAVMDRPTTLSAFALSVGNTVSDVVELNPGALAKPSVSAGTTLRYYASP